MANKNNNNTTVEVIKKNLNDLLIKIEHAKKTLRSKKSYIYIDDKIAPVIPRDKLKFLNITTSLLTCLIDQFRSVDDLNSVKRLRQAELFFLNNYELRIFTFPSYASQIAPLLIDCANLEIAIDAFDNKAKDLLKRGHETAAINADWIVFVIRLLIKVSIKNKDTKINNFNYKDYALGEILKARPILEQHRGWKKIIANLILLITTLGTAHICNKIFNNHYLFFRETDSAKQLKQLEHKISKLAS